MANLGGTFDATQVDPTQEFEPLPQGKYHAQVISSEKRGIGQDGGKGEKLTLCWQIMTGPLEGRMVWQDLLLWYNVAGEKGDKTREIAQRQLSEVCHAAGKLNISDSEDLHHRPCEISVGFQRKQNAGDPDRNEVKGVKALNGGGQQQTAFGGGQKAAAPASSASAGNAPSGGGWARKAG